MSKTYQNGNEQVMFIPLDTRQLLGALGRVHSFSREMFDGHLLALETKGLGCLGAVAIAQPYPTNTLARVDFPQP